MHSLSPLMILYRWFRRASTYFFNLWYSAIKNVCFPSKLSSPMKAQVRLQLCEKNTNTPCQVNSPTKCGSPDQTLLRSCFHSHVSPESSLSTASCSTTRFLMIWCISVRTMHQRGVRRRARKPKMETLARPTTPLGRKAGKRKKEANR